MSTDRRTFLQRLLATAAGVGLSPGWLIRYGENYGGALAAMSRKRALLIGINTYPEPDSAFSLQGCLTDIELQRQLLLHRFGFAAADILTLADQEATVTRLNSTLHEISSQLHEEDSFLFHFSGLGLLQPDAAQGEGITPRSPALVLLQEAGLSCSNLPLRSLFQNLAALSTSQLTVLLDCGFNFVEPRVRGNLHLRSRPTVISQEASDQSNPSQSSQLPALPQGLLLAATSAQELAAEATWSGFVAGIFTYLLTQYLWEITPATKVLTAFNHVATQRELASLACQQPILQGEGLQSRQLASDLHTALEPGTRGWTGVIQEVKGNRASLWLGGVPPGVLCGLQNGTVLRAFPQDPGQRDVGKMVLRARNGLTAQATLVSEEKIPAVGTAVYERERALSLNMRLLVGMDDSLGRIEKVDITNALAALPWAEAVYPHDQRVDCLLGKLSTAGSSSGEGYGLFWPGREVIAGSWGPAGEAAKAAVQRLSPQLQHLLAAKLLRFTLNAGVTDLPVRATLYRSEPDQFQPRLPLLQIQSAVVSVPTATLEREQNGLVKLPAGEYVNLTLENQGTETVSAYVILQDGMGQLNVITPLSSGSSLGALQLSPGSRLEIPSTVGSNAQAYLYPDLLTCSPRGLTELLIVTSMTPFKQSLEQLHARKDSDHGNHRDLLYLERPLEWIQALLTELTQPSSDMSDLRYLQHQRVATLSLAYAVI